MGEIPQLRNYGTTSARGSGAWDEIFSVISSKESTCLE
jgi:hypothetical protein